MSGYRNNAEAAEKNFPISSCRRVAWARNRCTTFMSDTAFSQSAVTDGTTLTEALSGGASLIRLLLKALPASSSKSNLHAD
jgi:hypothetical protein